MKLFRTIVFALLGAVCACFLMQDRLFADLVIMKDGRAVRGKVISEDENDVVVEVPGGRVVFSRSRIRRIEKEKDEDYLLMEAERLVKLGALEDAIGYFKRALEIAPSFEIQEKLDRCYALLGEKLIKERNLRRAEEIYRILEETDEKAAGAGFEKIEKIRRQAKNREKAADGYFRTGQYGEALDIYAEVILDLPYRRAALYRKIAHCHAKLGNAALEGGDFAAAEKEYDEALELDPDLLAFLEHYWVATKADRIQLLLSKKNYRGARDLARKTLSVVPNNRVLHFLLGESYLGLGLESLAREEYRRAVPGFVITPSTTVMDLRKEALSRVLSPEAFAKLVEEEEKWKEVLPGKTRRLESKHFVIHHRNDYVAKRVSEAAEFHYARVMAAIDYLGRTDRWKSKCPIHVYPTREEYAAKASRPVWSGAVARLRQTRGALVEQDIICYQASGDLLESAIPHEIAHLVTSQVVGYDVKIPLWAYEGLAISFENSKKIEYYTRFLSEEYKRKNYFALVKLMELNDYPEEDRVTLYYAQSCLFVKYLLGRGGYPKFMKMLGLTKGGMGCAAALVKTYGVRNLLELEAGYLEVVKK